MDWPLGEPAFFEEDFDSVFLYQPRRSKAVYRFDGDTVSSIYESRTWQRLTLSMHQDITERWLDTDEDITKWLDEVCDIRPARGRAAGTYTIEDRSMPKRPSLDWRSCKSVWVYRLELSATNTSAGPKSRGPR